MPKLDPYLKITKCPHCSVDNPNLKNEAGFNTTADNGANTRAWKIYKCIRCGGVVTAWAHPHDNEVKEIFPSSEVLDNILPEKVKTFLQQAIDTVFAPSGSVMLCASAVDAMLKEKGYLDGSLYSRINKGVEEGLLTKEMGTWAHQVRLDANEQRHSDINAGLPTTEEAKQAIEFTKTLSEFLFVLPSRVTKGIAATKTDE